MITSIKLKGCQMTVNNTNHNQYTISSTSQAIIRSEEARENRERLQEINNEQIQRIQKEIDTASITGLGGSLNITG